MNYELFTHDTTNKKVYLIDMTRERGFFSEMVEKGIRKYVREKKKILCIVNKKGFASGLFCTSCGHIPQCDQCSVSIAYHDISNKSKADNGKGEFKDGLLSPKRTSFGRDSSQGLTISPSHQFTSSLSGICHICKKVYDLPTHCAQCHKSDTLKLYGLTIQKTELRFQQQFGISPLIIQSETVASLPKINRLLPELEKAQVVIGTNVVGVGVKYDLVIILAADQSLTLPDYSVRQDTFVQLNGIINNTDTPTIIIQSYDTQHDSIRYACKGDEQGFFTQEKKFREQYYYPPYGELCVIKYKNENESTLHNSIQALTKELLYLQQSYEYPSLTIYATPPLVYKKFGKFYYHIIVLGPKDTVRPFMDIAFSKLQMRKRGFKIDRMAHHIV